MRPAPQAKHLVAVLIFAGVATAGAYLAMVDDDLGQSQVNIASAAVKRAHPDLYPSDPIFGDSALWRMHTPIFYGLLDMMLFPTGYTDPSLPFRTMAGALKTAQVEQRHQTSHVQAVGGRVKADIDRAAVLS